MEPGQDGVPLGGEGGHLCAVGGDLRPLLGDHGLRGPPLPDIQTLKAAFCYKVGVI